MNFFARVPTLRQEDLDSVYVYRTNWRNHDEIPFLRHVFFFHLARVSQRSSRVALIAVLLGAILAFGVCSLTPSAHAAAVGPRIASSVNVKIITQKALSVRVISSSLKHCYNTPGHTVAITGLTGVVTLIGYASSNCAGGVLCTVFARLPSSGTLIIRIC